MNDDEKGVRRFHLSDDAREYFEKIGVERKKGDSKSGMFSAYVEPYYLCLMMGMIKNKGRNPDVMSKDMVSSWKSSAREFEKEITGVVFQKFCENKGIEQGDDRILKVMENFFANERAEVYNREAFNMMNYYAQGGFDYIRENLGPCNQLADFLVWYLEEIEGMY